MATESAPRTVASLFSLTGKTAIVLGGTGGLGQVMTLALAESGADIVSIELPKDAQSQTLSESIQKTSRKISVFECDISDSKSLRKVFSDIWDAGVVPDILLNSAGIQRRGKAEELSDKDIEDVNLLTQIILNQNHLANNICV
jgi:2-deoxy-D-gluconate 3-dehydrogenase